jgi:hypothetical protein
MRSALAAIRPGISSDRPWFGVSLFDNFKDVTIRVSEKEAVEWRFAQRLDETGSVRFQPLFQRGESSAGNGNRNVAAKFPLETRRLEFGILDQMQFAPWPDFEPSGGYTNIARPRDPRPIENIPEEGRRLLYVSGCQRDVCQAHRLLPHLHRSVEQSGNDLETCNICETALGTLWFFVEDRDRQ